jgi:hypothetical protein
MNRLASEHRAICLLILICPLFYGHLYIICELISEPIRGCTKKQCHSMPRTSGEKVNGSDYSLLTLFKFRQRWTWRVETLMHNTAVFPPQRTVVCNIRILWLKQEEERKTSSKSVLLLFFKFQNTIWNYYYFPGCICCNTTRRLRKVISIYTYSLPFK